MQATEQRLVDYLEGICGSKPDLQKNLPALTSKLPLFLRARYSLCSLRIFGRKCLLAVESKDCELGSPAEYAAHALAFQKILGECVAIVLPKIPSYARNRMVQAGTPFIVPGSQMFLPAMMLDLRERFSTPAPAAGKHLTPASQCLLLYHLLHKPLDGKPLKEIAEQIGYSTMNLSRAKDELQSADLCRPLRQGRSIVLKFTEHAHDLWTKALPVLSSPVRKSHWVDWHEVEHPALPAGLTALSHCSMIEDDRIPTYAIAQANYRKNLESGLFREAPGPSEANLQLQAWSYNPLLLEINKQIDPLSLYLSLRDSADERIQIQLESMIKEVHWT